MNICYGDGVRAICIGNLPKSKKKCLYIENGSEIRKVATFTSDEDADYFERVFVSFIEHEEREDQK